MKHFTFDLETLGGSSLAPIVQLACVEFELDGKVSASFDHKIDLKDCFELFSADISTIEWWLKQSDKARSQVFPEGSRYNLKQVLESFQFWIQNRGEGPKKFWSHATFDPPILMNSFQVMKMKAPIAYRDFVDIRTLNLLAGDVQVPERATFGEHHEALADCGYQAAYIAAMLRKLGMK
jgi:hypothetical protein